MLLLYPMSPDLLSGHYQLFSSSHFHWNLLKPVAVCIASTLVPSLVTNSSTYLPATNASVFFSCHFQSFSLEFSHNTLFPTFAQDIFFIFCHRTMHLTCSWHLFSVLPWDYILLSQPKIAICPWDHCFEQHDLV